MKTPTHCSENSHPPKYLKRTFTRQSKNSRFRWKKWLLPRLHLGDAGSGSVLPVGRFSRTIGLFFRCVAGNFLLLRVAFSWASFIKVHAFFGLLLLNNFSVIEYSFSRFYWSSENCFDLKQCDAIFLVRFCSLDVRTNITSLEITWSIVCDRMGNSVDHILTGQGGGLLWSHHTRGGSSQAISVIFGSQVS